MTAEQWRPVPGYEGMYEVSDIGRVRNLYWRGSPFIMRQQVNSFGYLRVQLGHRGERRDWPVHRLVLMAFDRAPLANEQCRHLNGTRADNRRENLTWGSASENVQDTIRHGRHRKLNATHCVHGHPFDAANTMIVNGRGRNPRRVCRACKAASRKRARVA